MKLKKIASLMLAGIMAVSMLAGCKTASNNGNGGEGEGEVTPTSTTASVLRENLGGNARRNVTAVADSDLDAALKSAVADYCTDNQIDIVVENFDLVSINTWALGEAVIDDNEDSITKLKNTDGKDVTAIEVFAIDKSVSDNWVLEKLADKINTFCDDNYLPDKSTNGDYDYDYEISASIVSVDSNNTVVDQGVKFVAFSVTKLATKYV